MCQWHTLSATDFVRKHAAYKRCQMRLAHLNGIQNVPLAHFAAKIRRSKRQSKENFVVYYKLSLRRAVAKSDRKEKNCQSALRLRINI